MQDLDHHQYCAKGPLLYPHATNRNAGLSDPAVTSPARSLFLTSNNGFEDNKYCANNNTNNNNNDKNNNNDNNNNGSNNDSLMIVLFMIMILHG